MSGATVSKLADADGKRCEHGGAFALRMAVERFFDMLEAGLHRHAMTRQQGELRCALGETLERRETVIGRELADGVHPRVQREWRDARTGVADFGDARCDLRLHLRELLGRHGLASKSYAKLSHFG